MSGVALAMLGAVSQGVLWGLMVLGVYITYKILDIADLTVDGSFALGGCVCAAMIANKGMNPILAILIALLAGLAAGAVTGFLHTVFDIPAILSGILTQIALWSINLRIMGGKIQCSASESTDYFFRSCKSYRTDTVSGFSDRRTDHSGTDDRFPLLAVRNGDWCGTACDRQQ